MPAPASALDVANLALLKLYAKPITSLADTTSKAAIIANTTYDQARRSLLRMYRWNFAQTRGFANLVAEPPPNATTPLAPAFDYRYQYAMPNDLIRLLHVGKTRIHAYPGEHRRYSYDIQGKNILVSPCTESAWCELSSVASAPFTITGMTNNATTPITVTVSAPGICNGDGIMFSNMVQMLSLNNNQYMATNVQGNQFQITDIFGNFVSPANTDVSWVAGGVVTDLTNPIAQPPASIDILYVQDAQDVTQFDPLFIDALTYKLAMELCMPISGSAQMLIVLNKAFELVIKEAQGINFQEKPFQIIDRDPIQEARIMAANVFYPGHGGGTEAW